jgi:hypothetical protein
MEASAAASGAVGGLGGETGNDAAGFDEHRFGA